MNKRILFFLLFVIFVFLPYGNSESQEISSVTNEKIEIYSDNNKFGLKNTNNLITKPIFKKIIKLGNTSWIVQYKDKYGLLGLNGEYIIKPEYRVAERVLGKYAKFGNNNDFGLYDEFGEVIISPEYSSIDILCRDMFLTCKNYKYGITDTNGNIVLKNEFEQIYMATPNLMIVQYKGIQYSIEGIPDISFNSEYTSKDENFKIGNLIVNTGVISGYSVVTLTDYALKILSALSPAYESTIDELMFSQGAETISILLKFSWLPKFPIVYVKNYYKYFRRSDNSLLTPARNSLKKQLK